MTIRCMTCTEKCDSNQLDTELIDTLVAISVVSKRLAEKLNTLSKQEKAGEGGNRKGTDMFPSWLKDGHRNLLDVINSIKDR